MVLFLVLIFLFVSLFRSLPLDFRLTCLPSKVSLHMEYTMFHSTDRCQATSTAAKPTVPFVLLEAISATYHLRASLIPLPFPPSSPIRRVVSTSAETDGCQILDTFHPTRSYPHPHNRHPPNRTSDKCSALASEWSAKLDTFPAQTLQIPSAAAQSRCLVSDTWVFRRETATISILSHFMATN